MSLFIGAIGAFIYSQTFLSASRLGFYYSNQNDTEKVSTSAVEVSWLENLKEHKEKFVKSLEDNFYPRTALVDMNAKIKIHGLNYIGTSKAILGKNGMYFEGYGDRMVEAEVVNSFDNVADYLGASLYTDKELEAWVIAIEERYYWHKAQGIKYIFAVSPAKAHIYPENLPDKIVDKIDGFNRQSRIDQLTEYLDDHTEVPTVDLRAVLQYQKTQDDRPLYYRTDFHWNLLGAFYAYQSIVKKINIVYPEVALEEVDLNSFEVERSDNWVSFEVMKMVGLDPYQQKNETYFTLTRKQDDIKIKRLKNEKVKFPIIEFLNSSAPKRKIFVIGDSFIEMTSKYFSQQAHQVWNFRAIMDFSQVPYEDSKPDIVVQAIHNMYLLQPAPINKAPLKKARLDALSLSQ